MSIKVKLLLPFLLIFITIYTITELVWFPLHKENIIKNSLKVEKSYLKLLGESLITNVLSYDLANVYKTLNEVIKERKPLWTSIELIDADGTRLYPIEPIPFSRKNTLVEHRIIFNEKQIAILKADVLLELITEHDIHDYKKLQDLIFITLFIFSIVGFFIQFVFVIKPLKKASLIANDISNSRYDVAMPKPTNDEVGVFINSFKVMISNIKEREDQLKLFKKAFSESGHSIFITNNYGEIQYVNSSFCVESGYQESELIGQKPSILKSGKQNPEYYEKMWSTLKSGNPWNEDIINKKKNGVIYYIEQSISPIFNRKDEVEAYVAIQMDVTLQKELYLNLEKEKKIAEQANKAKSEFIANMSHEIRTPLNAVIGFSEILIPSIHDADNKKCAEAIKIAGNNLLGLINDILDLSKIEAGMLTLSSDPVNLNSLFKEITYLFQQAIETKNLDFKTVISEETPQRILLDEIRLRQSIVNLIGNAIKFTRKGSVEICATSIHKENQANLIDLIISIKDTGIGIPKDQHELIFESFKQQNGQSNRTYGGTGLGLSITKKFIEMMNGDITLDSEPNVGSEFKITLKDVSIIHSGDEKELIPENLQDIDISFKGKKVLVVDDVKLNRDLLNTLLTKIDFTVKEAINGEEAIFLVNHFKPDIILMDIRMPVMDGYEATRIIKNNSETKHIPVIATTASVHIAEINIEESDFDEYLAKPINLKKLIASISDHIQFCEKNMPKEIIHKEDIIVKTVDAVKLDTKYFDTLEKDVYELWLKCKESNDFEKIANFNSKLKLVAEESAHSLVIDYQSKLENCIDSFDIDQVNVLLNNYTKLLDDLS